MNEELFKILKQLLLIGKLTGVNQIAWKSRRHKNQFHASKYQIIVAIFYLILYSTTSIISFNYDNETIDTKNVENVSVFRNIVKKYLHFLLGCNCIITSLLQTKKFIQYLKNLAQVDNELLQLDYKLKYQQSKLYFYKIYLLEVILLIVITTVCFIYQNIFTTFSYVILVTILYSTFSQFIGCLHLLTVRFSVVNRNLDEFYVNHGNENKGKVILLKETKLKILSICHDKLCDAAKNINEYYMFQLLCFVTLVFLATLFTIYSNFKILFGSEGSKADVPNGIISLESSAISIFMAVLLLTILSACSTTSDTVSFFFLILLVRMRIYF